jgi:hypothetical protein
MTTLVNSIAELPALHALQRAPHLLRFTVALGHLEERKTMTTDISSYGVIELTRAEASKTCGGNPVAVAAAAGAFGGATTVVVIFGVKLLINWISRH